MTRRASRRTGPAAGTAIQTSYGGYRFRSRLEARYAVLFDALAMEWAYEPQGYTVGPFGDRRRYLPDFWLPEQGVWIEVKGSAAGLDYPLMLHAAHPTHGLPLSADTNGEPVRYGLHTTRIVLFGPVPTTGPHEALAVLGGEAVANQLVQLTCCGDVHRFVPVGAPVAATPDRSAERAAGRVHPLQPAGTGLTECDHTRDGYHAARTARFEHGQTPPTPSRPRGQQTRSGPSAARSRTGQGG